MPLQDVIKLETQYWTLVDIPRQEKQETVPAFVLRACSIMEKTHKSGEGVKTSARLAEEAETKRERIERLESEYWLKRDNCALPDVVGRVIMIYGAVCEEFCTARAKEENNSPLSRVDFVPASPCRSSF